MTAPARAPRLFTLRRIVTSVLLAVAAAGFYVGFSLHDDAPNPRLRPQAVRTVSPLPGTLQLRQTEIFVELEPAYRGTLSVNGTPIPPDDLNVIEGLNRFSFTPGAGRQIEMLPPGRTCAAVTFQLVTDPAAEPGSYRWCFNVS
ncbi:MAG: hypothetical protein M3Q48_10160 [Actinomycetota bacterium]|nr:hypothetical protein [Actinomycetota bacterium]